jgi:syntaxin-binding protein 5
MGQQFGQGASQMGQQIGQGATAIFGRMQNALAERGEMLDSVQESMRNLQEGSKNALNQARMAAAKQGAKSWFSSLG